MSNGKDKPGENRVLDVTGLDAAAQTALIESQTPNGFEVVAVSWPFVYLYRENKH